MCHTCWENEGFPYHKTDAAMALVERVNDFAPIGHAHIVIDDCNLHDGAIVDWMNDAANKPDKRELYFAMALKRLTYAERWAVVLHHDAPNFTIEARTERTEETGEDDAS